MNCAEAEILICDLVDGVLAPGARAELERHLAACSGCAELARDSAAAVSFLEQAAAVEPPPQLVTRILFDPPWGHARARAAAGIRNRLRQWIQPALQPRLAMGMAMTILFFAMMAKFVKPLRTTWSARDLDPKVVWASVDDRVDRTWQRTVKFYESLRVVYQIQSTVREWQQEQQALDDRAEQSADERRLPVKGASPPASGSAGKNSSTEKTK